MKMNQSNPKRLNPIVLYSQPSKPAQNEQVLAQKPKRLEIKSLRQRRILIDYYQENKKNWSRKDIRTLSLRTGLSCEKVYKYLWNKRNKEQKLNQPHSPSQVDPQVKNNGPIDNSAEVVVKKKNYREIQIKRVIIEMPENIMYAREFNLLNSQQVPPQAIQMLIQGGFSLILDQN